MAQRKRQKDFVLYEDPLKRPDYTEADVQALRAVSRGHATPEQQTRAIDWLIHAFGTYDTSFRRGGTEADRDTIFAEGRRHAGQILVWMLKYAPAKTSYEDISARVHAQLEKETGNNDEQGI